MTETKIVMGSTTYLVEPKLAELLKPDIVEMIEWMMGRGWPDEWVRAGIQEFLGGVHKRFPGYVRIEGRREDLN